MRLPGWAWRGYHRGVNGVLVGEVQELVDGCCRVAHLGERVAVRDRRRFAVAWPLMFPPDRSRS